MLIVPYPTVDLFSRTDIGNIYHLEKEIWGITNRIELPRGVLDFCLGSSPRKEQCGHLRAAYVIC